MSKNAGLSLPEIEQQYKTKRKYMPLQINPSFLGGYLPMVPIGIGSRPDGSSADGDVVKDLSINGNNGTASGGIWTAEEVFSYLGGPIYVVSPKAVIIQTGTLIDNGLINNNLANSRLIQ